jgi:antitoxin (DNA-binding transcriptional repressor) of toxin-antitoxin stability system
MKTLTATQARANLTHWLKAAKNGEEIGIVYGADIIALRPVEIHASDYPQAEYGVSNAEMARFTSKADAEIEHDAKAGKLQVFTGKLPRRRVR